jgi:outer membrane protein W
MSENVLISHYDDGTTITTYYEDKLRTKIISVTIKQETNEKEKTNRQGIVPSNKVER